MGGEKKNKTKQTSTYYLNTNTSLVCLQTEPITGVKQHETRFWITCFRGHFCYQHVKTADSYEEFSPLNICSLNWSFRRGSNNWCCLKRCHRATIRTIRLSSYLTWLPNKTGLLRWFLPKKNRPKPLILSHTSSLDGSFTSASHKKLCMPQLQPYSSTMSTLGHLAELDVPPHNNYAFLLKKVIVLDMGGVQSSIMDTYKAIDCYTESCKLLIQHSVHLQSKHKTSWNQKRKQVITEVLLFATFCSLQPKRRGQLQGIKAPFTGCKVPSE